MVSPEIPEIHVTIGERIVGQVSLTHDEVATFARLSGDLNPLHYDEAYARQTRFESVIVSGPQLVSLMMGLTATYFSRGTAMLGLEFTFQFRQAVKVGETVRMEWQIVTVEPKASLQGVIAGLEGQAINDRDQVVLTGSGKVLIIATL